MGERWTFVVAEMRKRWWCILLQGLWWGATVAVIGKSMAILTESTYWTAVAQLAGGAVLFLGWLHTSNCRHEGWNEGFDRAEELQIEAHRKFMAEAQEAPKPFNYVDGPPTAQ